MAREADINREKPPILEYRARRWNKLWRHRLYILIVLASLGAGFITCRYWLVSKAQILIAQSRCLRHPDDPAIPVFVRVPIDDWPKFSTIYPSVRKFDHDAVWTLAGRVEPTWQWLRTQLPALPEFHPQGTIFVGSLRSSSGLLRLVAVDVSLKYDINAPEAVGTTDGGGGPWYPIALEIGSIEPAGLLSSAKCNWSITRTRFKTILNEMYNDSERAIGLAIYSGQVDPQDISRFRAKIAIGAREGIIVGNLLDDGTVKLSVEGFDALRQ